MSDCSTSGLGCWTIPRSPRLRRRRGHRLTCPLPPWRGKVGMAPPPLQGEGRLGANPAWPGDVPTPLGRTTLE
jgi:hypothetical protein